MLFFGGLALWLVSTLVQTRLGAFVSLWTVALFIGGLLIVTLPTRTLTVAELLPPFCFGGAVLGIAVLAGWAFDLAFGTKESGLRAFGIPLIEEALKIAPVLLILWRYRQGRIWTLGATDVLLLAAAAGAGFYWVEEAFIIHHQGSWAFLGSFPTTEVTSDRHGSHVTAGHALWTSIAGLTIGLGLLLRGSKLQVLLIGASGWLWSMFDHGANNYNANYRDSLNRVFQVVTGDGHLSLYIFVVGACLAVALDLYFAYLALPALAEVKHPAFPSSWEDAKRAWRYLRVRREFAYAVARYQRESGFLKARAVVVAGGLDAALVNWWIGAAK